MLEKDKVSNRGTNSSWKRNHYTFGDESNPCWGPNFQIAKEPKEKIKGICLLIQFINQIVTF